MNKKLGHKGQAIAEMMVILPVLVILASIAMGVAYMCYQGIKVQEAANYAARLEGQERVAGGSTSGSIDHVNGVGGGQHHDTDITDPTQQMSDSDVEDHIKPPPINSVYGKYYVIVRSMFTGGEQGRLLVPPPVQGTDIDQVKVIRVMNPPTVFGIKIPQVIVTGTAYGGEDSNMYALPRWGCTGDNTTDCSAKYWQQSLHPEDKSSTNPLGRQ